MIHPSLMPPDQYREMAQSLLDAAPHIHEFLNACEACGLPVADRRQALNDHCTFCQNFLKNFYPQPT